MIFERDQCKLAFRDRLLQKLTISHSDRDMIIFLFSYVGWVRREIHFGDRLISFDSRRNPSSIILY